MSWQSPEMWIQREPPAKDRPFGSRLRVTVVVRHLSTSHSTMSVEPRMTMTSET